MLGLSCARIHPWNINALKQNELEHTLNLIDEQTQRKSVVAIGEIGLDSKYETGWEKQLDVFDKMLRTAERTKLPAIIHSVARQRRYWKCFPHTISREFYYTGSATR